MKTFKLYITLTVALLASLGMNAQQGTTHNHPLDAANIENYLVNYLGITNYSGNNWAYTATRSGWGGWFGSSYSYAQTPPPAVAPGEAIFVEVNDYWRGSNWDNPPSLYDQVKYGIKAIHKIEESTTVGNGKLYHFDATTNRFFFAIRTTDFYDNSWSTYSGDNCYHNEGSNPMPFRWYNEFSAVTSTSGDGWNGMKAAYDGMKDGDFLKVPHSCSNSLEKNHFTTLYDKTVTDQTYSMSAMLFVPDGTNASSNNKNANYSGNNIPYVFFYVNKLTGNRVSNENNPSDFAIDLNWSTSIDKGRNSNINITTWNSTKGGVKEESRVYRKIEGDDEFSLVEELTDLKSWTDNSLPNRPDGYDVTYYVVTELVTYNAAGQRTGEIIGTAVTNQVTFHIPGKEQYFELSLGNIFSCHFVPTSGQIHQSANHVTNSLSSTTTEFTPTLSTIKVGDTFTLYRNEEGKGNQAIRTLAITSKSGNTWGYTLNGVSSSATWNNTQQLLNIVASYNDEVDVVPGRLYDAKYQLFYTTSTNEYYSNVVTAQGKRTDVKVEKAYRSGTPDPTRNAIDELYTVDVKFHPIMSDDIAHYYIWRNATERVARIGQSGTTYTIVGRDDNGNFNIDLGTTEPDADGFITVAIDNAINKFVCEGEQGQGTALAPNDLFFTVEVCTTGNNSYGNYDRETNFNGTPDELVINSYGRFYVGNDSRPGQYCAEISWEKIKDNNSLNREEDYVMGEPSYYTVYRYWLGSNNNVVRYEPITKFWIGHNDIYDAGNNLIEAGNYELADETDDGSAFKFTPEIMEEFTDATGQEFCVIDFITDRDFVPNSSNTFPAMYYVTAHYDNHWGEEVSWYKDDNGRYEMMNQVEKNSNPTRATSLIVTGIEEKAVSQVVSTTYYNIMGIKVAQPAAGEIVIAQSKHADGSTTSRVIKM